jgi:hypothetical protein
MTPPPAVVHPPPFATTELLPTTTVLVTSSHFWSPISHLTFRRALTSWNPAGWKSRMSGGPCRTPFSGVRDGLSKTVTSSTGLSSKLWGFQKIVTVRVAVGVSRCRIPQVLSCQQVVFGWLGFVVVDRGWWLGRVSYGAGAGCEWWGLRWRGIWRWVLGARMWLSSS